MLGVTWGLKRFLYSQKGENHVDGQGDSWIAVLFLSQGTGKTRSKSLSVSLGIE